MVWSNLEYYATMPHKPISNGVRVVITLFPPFATKGSKERIVVALEENSTVKDLLEYLVKNDQHFKTHLGEISREEDVRLHALILHNDRVALLDQLVQDGDHFKFLHPVQGGGP